MARVMRSTKSEYSSGAYSNRHQQSIGYWNVNQVTTNGAMTHVLVLSAKARINKGLCHTLDIDNVFGPTFGFKNSQKFQIKE